MSNNCLVIPCYNEEKRLDIEAFKTFVLKNELDICFVNDGSKDGTSKMLEDLSKEGSSFSFLNLEQNSGKAEAVRHGMNHCFEKGYEAVGFWDADLATPLEELPQFLEKLNEYSVVIGSRVLRLGGDIERKWYRHILGRVFATTASLLLKMSVYDTQCGAKFFKTSDCKKVFQEPFMTQWLFDVEIFFRLKKEGLPIEKFYEVPLRRWEDAHGSKLKVLDFVIAPFEMIKMYLKYK